MIRAFTQRKCGTVEIYGRNYLMGKIRKDIMEQDMPENIAILGVKGVGKTTLINHVFSAKNRREYYDEASVVVAKISFPERTENMEGFYSYLFTKILDGLDQIEKYDRERYEKLDDAIIRRKERIVSRCVVTDEATVCSVLNATIDLVLDDGLKLLILFDDFERFADSSHLKNAQYKFMRELANSRKLSLFIATGQDLMKVSAEMRGSGFENIFRYEKLRGIKKQDIEIWIDDVEQSLDIKFDDDIRDWIEEISGGIPEIIIEAGQIVYEEIEEENDIEEDEMEDELYCRLYELMKFWWEYTEESEHDTLYDVLMERSKDTSRRDGLIKKGYLEEDDEGNVEFATPILKRFVQEQWELFCEKLDVETTKPEMSQVDILSLISSGVAQKVVQEVVPGVHEAIEDMEVRMVDHFNETFETFILSQPSRDSFYNGSNGELDFEKYGDALSSYICKKLGEKNEQEIWEIWNITPEMWSRYSEVNKNDCIMAYRLSSLIFTVDIEDLDYTPLTVMLGNFLEGILNSGVLNNLRKYLPYVKVNARGRQIDLKDHSGTLMIGEICYIFKNEPVNAKISSSPQYDQLNLDNQMMNEFKNKLRKCHKTRNDANHPGQITTYQKKNEFIKNMFLGENSIVKVIHKLQQL